MGKKTETRAGYTEPLGGVPTGGGYGSVYGGKSSWGSRTWTASPSCHESHPVLKIGGGEILGASCGRPREGFDVYVGFDRGMSLNSVQPWMPDQPEVGTFFISDRCAPKSPKDFKLMLEWLASKLADNKRVHVGCIGGHGRTGLVLAALVSYITGEKDAIRWVREHHCKKAVESESQVTFLVKHFGITKAPARDQPLPKSGTATGRYPDKSSVNRNYSVGADGLVEFDDPDFPEDFEKEMGVYDLFPDDEPPPPRRATTGGKSGTLPPMKGPRNLW